MAAHQSRHRRVLRSLSLAAPEFGPRKLYADLGRAGQDDDNVFAVLWTNDRQQRTMSLVCAARVRALAATHNEPATGDEDGA